MKVKTDMEITVKVPRVIDVNDYHELPEMERILRLLNHKICVTELAFDDLRGAYIGLIHMNTRAHKKLIKELTDRLVFEK